MVRAFAVVSAFPLLIAFGCSHGADLTRPATQEQVGVQMAKMNLWREAMFRFERAVQLNPSDAMAHNNLAVAFEANGDFDKAAREYREALKLDRSNQYIQKNYSRYTEFMSRNKKREQRQAARNAAASPTVTPAAASTESVATAPPAAAPPAPATPAAQAPPPPTTPPPSTTNPPGAAR